AAERDANEQLLATVTLDDLLPGITVNGQKRALVDPANCYVTNDGSAPAYPVLTNITAIPVNAPENFANTCYNEESIGVHVSETAVYLTQDVPDNDSRNTRLHKFGIGNGAPAYHGSGEIDGSVWTGGQADFRLNETDGRLRVFTTDRLQPGTDMLEHRLFVLAEDQSRLALEVVGSLPNASRPEPIGKPNEDLFGVRFVGQRAYAVTFERIDPLYVIDLSDPSDPRIAGELEVPGVSDLLHPVSDALLLGLGRSADNRLKLELFDVSDIANPLSAGVELLGGPWTYSEATWNRHAFTYLADVNGVDRFTVPADLAGEGPGFSIAESGLYLYEIRDKATPSLASLVPAGSMTIYRDGDADVAASAVRNRGVLDGEAVYFIRDDALYSAFWASPSALNGPL
ncbi:MAG: beta-propeller domain-containing protein, partial [Pseudomonadota bacterium]